MRMIDYCVFIDADGQHKHLCRVNSVLNKKKILRQCVLLHSAFANGVALTWKCELTTFIDKRNGCSNLHAELEGED